MTNPATHLLRVLLPLVMLSCQESPTISPTPPSPPEFPNSAGTRWTYLYEVPLLQYSDTVHYVVGEAVALPSGAARIWRITRSAGRDSQYVRQEGDTIRVFDASRRLTGMYLWPPVIGRGWTFSVEPDRFDTAFVEGRDTIVSPAGTWPEAWRVRHEYSFPWLSSSGSDTTWLVPGVGIAEQRVSVLRNMQSTSWTLRLISFSRGPSYN